MGSGGSSGSWGRLSGGLSLLPLPSCVVPLIGALLGTGDTGGCQGSATRWPQRGSSCDTVSCLALPT